MRAFIVIAAILLGALVVLVLESVVSVFAGNVALIATFTILVMAIGFQVRGERRLPLIVDPFVLVTVFLGQFYVVGSLSYVFVDLPLSLFFRPAAPESVIQAMLGFLALYVCFVVGYRMNLGETLAGMLPDSARWEVTLRGRWIEAVVIGGSILGCLVWLDRQGGLLARFARGYGQGSGSSFFALAQVGLLPGTMLLVWRVSSRLRPSRGSVAALIGLIGFDVIFYGVILGSRKYLFYLFFGLLTIWILRRGVESIPKVRVAAMLALLLVFFSVWGITRGRPLDELVGAVGTDVRAAGFQPAHYGYLQSVTDPFRTASLIWDLYPDERPFRHGTTLLVTVFGFIPRSVWPEKPVGIGKELAIYVSGPFYQPTSGHSVTPTVPGDLYLNFGWFGIVLGGLLIGLICRTMTGYALHGLAQGRQAVASRVLIPAVFIMGLGELRSDMATMLAVYIFMAWPILIALTFFRMERDGVPLTQGGPG